eukprot:CAMPEP_0197190912 /NCGR_PEP_ID=MMETSP1423-20130617/22472_1 /TAXON_ID=476441 /ORGANISM="Pseudo-nitzschia heimii, Strain UNC1101" /LENGTH=250 /DNA_ID=CAMNT_0042643395 /DNA_START=108 /DNA_END=860 /DNA_ORIENTATION=-
MNNENRSVSPRSVVRARDFQFFDHSKVNRIPSILRKKNQLRYSKDKSLEAARHDGAPQIESNLQPIQKPDPTPCYSPSGKILKIIMPNDLDGDSQLPSSFSPPSNKLPMKKMSHEYREVSSDSRSSRSTNNVRFHSKVLVMRIPSRRQYPESMRRHMWCSLSEIARSAHRNTIEFSSEGWNWRSAVEEESMYIHPKTGQRIHPVHVQRAAAKTSTTPDVDKQQALAMKEKQPETMDDYNARITQAQPAHE